MTEFKYKVKNNTGEVETGVRSSTNKFVLYKEFKSKGFDVISIEPLSKFRLKWSIFSIFGKVKLHEKIILARNLGSMLDAGLPLSRVLTVIIKQATNKKLAKVLSDVADNISKGRSFSDSLTNFPAIFSPLFISMVKAGEESGNMADSLKMVSLQMDRNYYIQRKVKGAMVYPGIIFSVMLLIGIAMLFYVVPTLTSTFADLEVELPSTTKIVIFLSDVMRNNSIIGLSVLILIPSLITLLIKKTAFGKKLMDTLTLKLPVIGGIAKEVNSARTARTLASLLSAGVDVVESLKITEEVVQNGHYKKILKIAEENVQKGDPISRLFLDNTHLYPPFVGEMMSVGEETGKMSEMLKSVAEYYEDEVEQKTKDLSSIVEPVLMVIIGAAVGFFAISMISPMYSLVDKI